MNSVLISSGILVPKKIMDDAEVDLLRHHLVFMPKQMGDDIPEPIQLYKETENYLEIPLCTPEDIIPNRLQQLINDAEYDLSYGIDCTFHSRPDPNHPAVKDPEAQRNLMEQMLTSAQDNLAFIAQAPTGTGKTACALNTIAELGLNALIIVPTEAIATQWITSIKNLLGLSDDDIGLLQGNKIDIKNKKIVIGIVNSLAMKDYPSWVYRYFGAVVVDECHRVGSQVFSRAVPRFNARYKIGLSATPKRKDGADTVIQCHLGTIQARSFAEALFTRVYRVNYRSRQPVWGKQHGAVVKCLTLDARRNILIVKCINKLYKLDRDVLVVSDSIKHLQKLMRMCSSAGTPREVMGQFTGQREDIKGKRTKITQEELEYVKANSKIIFATYSMMKEAVDIPRLNAGIDATPRTDAIQLVGRIRRPFPNKPVPIWYTIVDMASKKLQRYYHKRKVEYLAENMEVIEQ